MKYRHHLSVLWFVLFFITLLSSCDSQNQVSTPQSMNVVVAPPTTVLPEAELVIQGGILLDMVADEANPVPVKGIVVRDGKIDRIIPADSADSLPSARRTINAGQQYILPGLIDSHVHFRPWVPDASIWRRASFYYGVTTLFDTGPCGETCEETGQDATEWIVQYRDFMNNPDLTDGPTLYITGKRIDGPADGGHPLAVQVNNAEEISDYLDYLVTQKVDGVKVESTLPADLRKIVVQEANKRGLPVVGHSKDARESIAAGMKFLEHMWPIVSSLMSDPPPPGTTLASPAHDYLMDLDKAPELIQLMVDNDVYINPTMVGRYAWFSESLEEWAIEDQQLLQFGGIFNDVPENKKGLILAYWKRAENFEPEKLKNHKEGQAKVETFLRLYTEAGGKVVPGTDAGQERIPGISIHRELHMLANAGITPYRVLLGATRWSAEQSWKDDVIGTIETGKQADILILGSNPVENIQNTRNIQYVIRKGKVQRTPDDCSVIFPPVSLTCKQVF